MKFAILYTGGTIGCVGQPLAPLGEAAFADAFRRLMMPVICQQYPEFEVEFIAFGESLDSTNLQPADWCRMAHEVLVHYATYDGFLIFHGTDTMAWSASALSFLLTGLDKSGCANALLSKPVVVTGAQLPLFHQGGASTDLSLRYDTDAYQNVCGAVAVLYQSVPEVCLYFGRRLLRGNRAVKTHVSEFAAFASPNYPLLGAGGVAFSLSNAWVMPAPADAGLSLDNTEARARLLAQLDYISKHINRQVVMPFAAYPAAYTQQGSVLARMLEACLAQGVKGLILEAYGEGNFPSGNPDAPAHGAICKVLKKAHEAGVVVLDCTQVLGGSVNASAYAAGAWLASAGVVGGRDMTPIAALAKLCWLSALAGHEDYQWDQAMLERLTQTSLAGEMSPANVLDSRINPCLMAGQALSTFDGSAVLINDPEYGPVLQSATGDRLWSALEEPSVGELPGRLMMQADGRLVLYDRASSPLFAAGTARPAPAACRLVLEGSTKTELKLYIEDCARHMVTQTLFSTGQGPVDAAP